MKVEDGMFEVESDVRKLLERGGVGGEKNENFHVTCDAWPLLGKGDFI